MTLIEVVASSLLVGLIAAGTVTGFATAGRVTADERIHAQATACAQQDEERLRGMTAASLGAMGTTTSQLQENCQPYTEGSSYTGTVFTVTSSATYLTSSESGASEACTTENAKADYIRTVSTVTWPALGSRQPVSQSSLVTAPLGAAVLVKVTNQNVETAEGVAVKISGSGTSETQTTGEHGCAIFGSLSINSANIEATRSGWVDESGNFTPSKKEFKIAGYTTTPVAFQMGKAGSISATFESQGTQVKGDTFVAAHTSVGSSGFDTEGTLGSYSSTVTSPTALFPFVAVGTPPAASPYTVYAGDCTANDPATVTSGAVRDASAQVEPGGNTAVKLTLAQIKIEVWSGTSSSPGSLVSRTSGATLTNSSCAAAAPNNYIIEGRTVPSTWVHTQNLASGHLENPYQPFGTFALCVSNGSRRYRTTVNNISASGTTVSPIYLSSAESTTSSCP